LAHAAIYGAATGLNYPDALTGGVYMATGGRLGPMLLVNTHAPLPSLIASYLNSLAPGTQGFVFGGPLAVGDDVLVALDAAVG
jgi:ell wall binding domain 2 (CWB2)